MTYTTYMQYMCHSIDQTYSHRMWMHAIHTQQITKSHDVMQEYICNIM